MVNYKLNPECPLQFYKALNVVTQQGSDWKELPNPVHARVMQDINRNVLILDGENPYKDAVFPVLDTMEYDLPEEDNKEEEDETEDDGILDGTVADVKEKISYISDKELLENILEEEKVGKNRKTVIRVIQEKL